MKNDALSVRQICFMLVAYNAVLKLIIYPTATTVSVGAGLIFSMLICVCVQAASVWIVAYLSSKTQKTLFELIKNFLGVWAARGIYAVLGLYFLLAITVPMIEQQLLVHYAFYDTVPSLYAFLPFFIFAVFAGTKTFTCAGRCADICMPVFCVCVIAIIIMSVGQADFSNLLPLGAISAKGVFSTSLLSLFKYSDGAFMLLFLGKYKYKKGDALKLTLSSAVGGLIVIVLSTIFFAIYGNMTPSRTFLLGEMCAFFPAISYVGRIDLPLIYALDTVILFALSLYIQASVHCFCTAFNIEGRIVPSLAVNALLLAITLLLNNKFTQLYQAAIKFFWIFAFVFAYVLPVSCLPFKGGEG